MEPTQDPEPGQDPGLTSPPAPTAGKPWDHDDVVYKNERSNVFPPISVSAIAAFLLMCVFFLGAYDWTNRHDPEPSYRTQTRGVATTATVVAAYPTFVTARLANGQLTYVHGPRGFAAADVAGEQVQVRIDPDDPAYAEFPGQPAKRKSWTVEIVVMIIVAATAGYGIWGFVMARRNA